MKLFCKQCGWNREKSTVYEDYECPICFSIMNENKEEFFNSFKEPVIENETVSIDEIIRLHIIDSFKRDIKKIGKDKTWNIIEGLSNARMRISYRRFYYLALEEIEKEV